MRDLQYCHMWSESQLSHDNNRLDQDTVDESKDSGILRCRCSLTWVTFPASVKGRESAAHETEKCFLVFFLPSWGGWHCYTSEDSGGLTQSTWPLYDKSGLSLLASGPDKANTGDWWQGRKLEWCWALGAWWLEDSRGGEGPGEEGNCRGGGWGGGGRGVSRLQKLPWTNGWLSRTSAVGRHFSSTNTCRRKSLPASDTPSGSTGFVGWVAILKMAAIASNSAHGGFWVNISTTVQATLLQTKLVSHQISNLIILASWLFCFLMTIYDQ